MYRSDERDFPWINYDFDVVLSKNWNNFVSWRYAYEADALEAFGLDILSAALIATIRPIIFPSPPLAPGEKD